MHIVHWLTCVLVVTVGCSDDPGIGHPDTTGRGPGGACLTDADCPTHQWCLHQRCSDRTTPEDTPGTDAHLVATPATLHFGTVMVGESRTLAAVLENDGDSVVTISRVTVAAPSFRVESMGYSPFWIRPERTREIFVTYAPTATGSHEAELTVHSQAPAVTITLLGN